MTKNFRASAGLVLSLLGTATLLAACADQAKPAHLDVSRSAPSDDSTDEWLRKKHLLRMTRRTSAGATSSVETPLFTATSAIMTKCWQKYEFGVPSGNACYDSDYSTNQLANICIARSFLGLANVQSDSVEVPDPSDSTATLVFDHVTEANAADLATMAADFGRFSIDRGLANLANRPTSCTAPGGFWVADPYDSTKSMAQRMAAATVEAYYLVRAAYDRAIEANLNVSDEARSSTSSVTEGMKRADLGPAYSRAAAAHLLVGGSDGILGSQQQGFCVGPDLTPQAKSALSLLRAAAPKPSLLRGTDMDALIQGPNADGSVRERLGQFYNISALSGGQPPETYYDLQRKDFQQARDYLVQEMDVMARSPIAATGTGFKRYAGSGGDQASPLPEGAWSARAGYWKPPAGCVGGGCPTWSNVNRIIEMKTGTWYLAPNGFNPTDVDRANWVMSPLSFLIGQTYSQIRNLLKTTATFSTTAGTSPTPQSKEVLGALASIIAPDEFKGTIEYMTVGSSQIFAVAHGYAAADKVRVVVGEDGLRCAVQGNIEGVSCADDATAAPAYPCASNATSLACLTLHVLTGTASDPYFSMPTYTGGNARSLDLTGLIYNKTRLYWVKLKNPNLTEQPGNYQLLAGTTILNNSDIGVPIIPSIDKRVDRALAPDTKRCSFHQVNCLDKEFDARLPLEDELSDNRDGVEDSWRHYLDLAKQAAQESDALGQEFIQNKLNKLQTAALAEQRKEEHKQAGELAIQEVQSACGTAMDSRKLLEFFSGVGNDNLGQVTAEPCTTTCTQPTMTCMAGRCVMKVTQLTAATSAFKDDPDAARLVACLDDTLGSDPNTNTLPFVTLGDKALCVYVRTLNPNDVCPQGLTDLNNNPLFVNNAGCVTYVNNGQCPQITTKSDTPGGQWTNYAVMAMIAKPLGYFQNNEPPADVTSPCSLFRRARTLHTPEAFDALRNTGIFYSQRFADTVGQLGFNAAWGGYWSLTENGGTRFTSGNVSNGDVQKVWPFAPSADCLIGTPPVMDPNQASGLLCSSMPAGPSTAVRGAFTARVLRAAFGATIGRQTVPTVEDHGLDMQFFAQVAGTDPNKPEGNHCVATSENTTIYKTTSAPGVTPVVTAPIRRCQVKLTTKSNGTVATLQGMGTGTDPAWIGWDGSTTPGPLNLVGPGDPNLDKGIGYRPYLSSQTVPGVGPISLAMPSSPELEMFGGLQPGNASYLGFVARALNGKVNEVSGAAWVVDQNVDYLSWITPPYEATSYHTPSGDKQGFVRGHGDSLLDGLELLCELDRSRGNFNMLQPPPQVTSLNDLDQAGAFLQGLAASISRQAASKVFARVPKLAADTLGQAPLTGTFPTLSGDMAEAVIGLRKGLEAAKNATPTLANEVRNIGTAMSSLRAELDKIDANKSLVNLDMLSTISSQTAACATAIADYSKTVLSGGVAAAATCANSAAQIYIATKKKTEEIRIQNDDTTIAIAAFNDRVAQSTSRLQEAANAIENASEDVNAALARIDGLRQRARTNLSRAVYLASYQSASQAAYDGSVGALSDLAQTRYQAALKNAKLMSFFAKRAIEQRLGIELATMTTDLPLVDAPQSWEGNICTMGGTETAACSGSNCGDQEITAVYGEGFIGDYVNKLERVVESYRLQHNFREGKDTAVISLRDDVANMRTDCPVPAKNMLKGSGDLTDAAAWTARTCTPLTISGVTYNTLNCIAAVPSPNYAPVAGGAVVPDVAVPGLAGSQTGASGYILQFGDGGTCAVATGGCGWKQGSALGQLVTLGGPARYRLSWYTRDSTAASPVNSGAKSSIVILRGTGSLPAPVLATSTFTFPATGSGSRWQRASVEFTTTQPGVYEIGFGSTQTMRPTETVTIAAPMLEPVPDSGGGLLPDFQLTDLAGRTSMPACQDQHGDAFRGTWRRQCVQLCDAGFSNNCTSGPLHCYREYSFGVSQGWIQNGKLFNYSGFARGNYNYRIDSLALNFVGSNVRDCENSPLPNTCYNAGFVPYSLYHTGPFFIRTDDGRDFETLLFDGKIEHARGLGLERYVTNPVSSTDGDLLKDYYRSELAGRPLDGNFVVRMWEEPGVDLDGIEDVQLVLNYRYWTSTN